MRHWGFLLAVGTAIVAGALAVFSAVEAKPKQNVPVFKLGEKTVVDSDQLAAELRYSPPPMLEQARGSEAAATSIAVEWYSRMLMSKAAQEDGLFERKPGLAAAAEGRAKALIATQYLQDYISREHEPTDEEVRQYYEMNTSLCAAPARLRLASIAIVMGRKATDAEKSGASDRIAQVEKRLAAGEDFGKIAEEVSDRPGREPGGGLGWLSAEEIGKFQGGSELLALEKGTIKRVDQPGGDVLFFKVLEREEPRRRSLEECRAEVQQAMNASFRQELALRLIDELAKRFDASINMDAFVETVRSVQPDAAWSQSWGPKTTP